MRASPHCSPAGTQGGPHQSLKIVLSYVLILCALCQEVQLCLYCSLFAMGAQTVFLGQPGLSVPTHLYGHTHTHTHTHTRAHTPNTHAQPGLSVPTHLYGQAVFTESVLCQRGSQIRSEERRV